MPAPLALPDSWQRPVSIALILAVVVLTTLGIHLVLHLRQRHLGDDEGSAWLNAAIDALNAPLQVMVWIAGLSAIMTRLTSDGRLPVLRRFFAPARDIALIVVVAWFLVRVVPRATRTLALRTTGAARDFDETAADAINKVLIASIIVVAAFIAVQSLGLSVASLLTFGGVAGLAVGFAAQGLVANLLGGVTIYTSKPFGVGDHIVLPGTELRGMVQTIGWRATRIVGWDGKPFYVPNAKFNTETIINHSRLLFREISEYVYLRLQDIEKVPLIVSEVNHMLSIHPEMHHVYSYYVFRLDSLGDQALKLYLYAYTKSTDYAGFMAAKEDILLKIAAIVEARDAQLARPVHHVFAPEGLQLATAPRWGRARLPG